MNQVAQSLAPHDARLLVLEDDAGHAEAIRRAFSAAGWTNMEIVSSLAAFRQRQSAQVPDLALADLFVTDGAAIELLHTPIEVQPYPVVIMTSHGNEQKAVEVLKAGAFDYVVKSAEAFAQMPHTLARIQREWALMQERKQSVVERDSLQRQLTQSQKMEAIGQLAGGIAHDFNNILASILGYTGLALARHVPDKESKLFEYLSQVKVAGERARDLVASMLAVTRLSRGDARALSASTIISEVTQLLRPIVPASIRFEAHVAHDLPRIWIDPIRLHQVLMNLCLNARDAVSVHGQIDVTVELSDGAARMCTACGAPLTGRWVTVAVHDNGCGMPPEMVAKIFDPFYTTKAVGHGTGLGLSMVHGFVHEASGHIQVTSAPGQGTTMQLFFPPLADDVVEDVHNSRTHGFPRGQGESILVVDDDVILSQLLGETLTTYGYTPTVFTDSIAALKHFSADPSRYRALITDYTMPGLTGGELASEMLALCPGLPIIICTGYTDKLSTESAAQLGATRFLAKPLPMEQLLLALAEVLKASDQAP